MPFDGKGNKIHTSDMKKGITNTIQNMVIISVSPYLLYTLSCEVYNMCTVYRNGEIMYVCLYGYSHVQFETRMNDMKKERSEKKKKTRFDRMNKMCAYKVYCELLELFWLHNDLFPLSFINTFDAHSFYQIL